MRTVYSKQKWQGFFTYLEGYTTNEQYHEVEFSMEIIITENSFIGTSIDSESKYVFDKPATVKGFIDNEKISFIMKYPCAYYKDDNGKIILDRDSEHPDIHYLGFFNEDRNSVIGNWEMTIYEEKYLEGYLEELLNGEFQMRKVN